MWYCPSMAHNYINDFTCRVEVVRLIQTSVKHLINTTDIGGAVLSEDLTQLERFDCRCLLLWYNDSAEWHRPLKLWLITQGLYILLHLILYFVRQENVQNALIWMYICWWQTFCQSVCDVTQRLNIPSLQWPIPSCIVTWWAPFHAPRFVNMKPSRIT